MSPELKTLFVIKAIQDVADKMYPNPPLAFTRSIHQRVIKELGRRIIVDKIKATDEKLPNDFARIAIYSGDFEVMTVYLNAFGHQDEAFLLQELVANS